MKLVSVAACAALVAIAVPPVLRAHAREPHHTETCTRIDPDQVAALFDRWNAALKTGNPDTVTRAYTPDAILIPTVSNEPRVGSNAIRAYFVDFLKKQPQGTIDQRIIRIGCNFALDAGTYTFTLKGDQPGSTTQVPARYTFLYEPRGGQWLIAHHHSSAMPEPVPAARR